MDWLIAIKTLPLVWVVVLPCSLIIGLYYSVTVKLHALTLLTLTPSFKRGYYHVHLSSILHPFTRGAYRDLALLIDLLPRYNGHTLMLTSPLLAKKGEFRDTEMLSKLPVQIEKRTLPFWRSPLVFLVLSYYKYMKRSPILQGADLSKQYQLKLSLNS